MLQPVSALDQIHALLLTGGGPMALGATAGVVRFLEERGVGYDWVCPTCVCPSWSGRFSQLAHPCRVNSPAAAW